jgi:AraC-like DNA-binding protein
MRKVLTTERLSPATRADVVRDAVWSEVVEIEIEHHRDPEDIRVQMALAHAGRIGICSVRSTATTVRRTSALAQRESEPAIFVGLQLSGSSMVVQDDREAVLHPGDIALYDTTRPYTLVFDEGIHQHFFRIPRASLALPAPLLRSLLATTLSPSKPVAALAATTLARMADPVAWTDAELAAVAPVALDLIRAALATRAAESSAARESLHATLAARIVAYLRANLGRPGLTASEVARVHNISVRHLYNVLGESGIVLGDWLQAQRLERCRADLVDPALIAVPVAAIAARWGFRDASHFTRRFRTAFGTTPAEYRRVQSSRS